MATDWGREESSTNALTRLTNLIDEVILIQKHRLTGDVRKKTVDVE